jgi:hypothetical protein
MNPPEREPDWRYPVRILSAAVVSIGGVALLLILLANAVNSSCQDTAGELRVCVDFLNRSYSPTREPQIFVEKSCGDFARQLRAHATRFFDARRPKRRMIPLRWGSPAVSSKLYFTPACKKAGDQAMGYGS